MSAEAKVRVRVAMVQDAFSDRVRVTAMIKNVGLGPGRFTFSVLGMG